MLCKGLKKHQDRHRRLAKLRDNDATCRAEETDQDRHKRLAKATENNAK